MPTVDLSTPALSQLLNRLERQEHPTSSERVTVALVRELLRLRTAVELDVSICQACSGTGQLPRREYDAASGEHEIVGWGSCLDCADLRAALRKDGER